MRSSAVPVTMGSPRFRSFDTRGFHLVHAWFPPHALLPDHTHDRPIVAFMLDGSFETRIARQRLECTPDTYWVEPTLERHANAVGPLGAHVLVVHPDVAASHLSPTVSAFLDRVSLHRSPHLAFDARRLLHEMSIADDVSSLAVESLLLGALTSMVRHEIRTRVAAPGWLKRVRECLDDTFRHGISVAELARVGGVGPSHLCAVFRRHTGMTIGEYVRTLRLRWALRQLEHSTDSISRIAGAAGYADHSHFTRECRRVIGVGPAEYRRGRMK
jgi:AraC family transcriptional regulator